MAQNRNLTRSDAREEGLCARPAGAVRVARARPPSPRDPPSAAPLPPSGPLAPQAETDCSGGKGGSLSGPAAACGLAVGAISALPPALAGAMRPARVALRPAREDLLGASRAVCEPFRASGRPPPRLRRLRVGGAPGGRSAPPARRIS